MNPTFLILLNKRTIQRSLIIRLTALSLGLSLTATTTYAQSKRVLRVHQPSENVTFNWIKATNEIDYPVIFNLQEGLTSLSRNLEIAPAMAQSWSYDETGTRIDFLLRSNIFWSDGKPVIAQHFVEGFKELLSRSLKLSIAYFLFDVRGAQEYFDGRYADFSQVGVTALSDQVLRIQLKEPNWLWVEKTVLPSLYPIRRDLIDAKGTAWTSPGNLVNEGPYMLLSHTHGAEFVLKRNPFYKLAVGGFEEVRFVICSFDEALARAKKLQMDVIFNLPYRYEALAKQVPGMKVTNNPPSQTRKLDINITRYPTSMLEVRRALAEAIDRKDLVQTLDTHWIPAGGWVLPGMLGHKASGGMPFNKAGAKTRFQSIFPKSQKPAGIKLLVPNFDQNRGEQVEIALYLKKTWEKTLGVTVELLIADTSQQYLVLRDTGEYHLLLRDQGLDTPDPVALFDGYASGSRFGLKWKTPEFDAWVKEIRTVKDKNKRLDILAKMDDFLLVKQVATIPLFYKGSLTAARESIRGIDRDRWRNYSLKLAN